MAQNFDDHFFLHIVLSFCKQKKNSWNLSDLKTETDPWVLEEECYSQSNCGAAAATERPDFKHCYNTVLLWKVPKIASYMAAEIPDAYDYHDIIN